MPTTYSTNLKLSLMATGENVNTWGSVTNSNLGTLLEQAIVGAGTVNMPDTDVTLTINDGAASTGRAVFLTLTGTLTATRTLTVPTINKNYIIYNNTTGSQPVLVKTSAGTGVIITNGAKTIIYVDGTDATFAISAVGRVYFPQAALS